MLQSISCTSICFDNFCRLGGGVGRYSVKPVASSANKRSQDKFGPGLWGDEAKRISERLKPQERKTDVYTRKNNIEESKPRILRPDEFLDGVVPARTNVDINKPEANKLRDCDVQEKAEGTLKPVAASRSNVSQEEPVHGVWGDEAKRISDKTKKQQETTEVFTGKTEVGSASSNLHVNASEANKLKCFGVERNSLTILVFDLETTGLSRYNDSIVEIGFRDLNGGVNNCFSTLVNPERDVTNPEIHGITTQMVNRPNVPRFIELIPIMRNYVKLRQIPGQPVLWIAHNARTFDVPFLKNEFSRCGEEIPSDWLFLDTLTLAREVAKLEGPKKLMGKTLSHLREYYDVPLVGKAHRAMADVDVLSMVLAKMTMDLKIPISGLLERSFKASDIGNTTTKKNKGRN